MLHRTRRIVTGHDLQGRSVVVSDAPATNILGGDDRGLINLWSTQASPASYDAPDPMAGDVVGLLPPTNGTIFRFFQIPPEGEGPASPEVYAGTRAVFEAMGAGHCQPDTSRHPAMHKTESVDYIVLLKGEVSLILDADERALKPFDVVVQRGTNHAWANRGTEPALLLAVLVDGRP